ncbi:MAG: GYD domain-containing protein [Candidatus Omnitrophica bacterium]|nr:GYD domain-containing protein [Candidatus Omnitrophota bacterium]
MAKFLMLGKYSAEAIKGISAERTKKAKQTIEKTGGKANAIYALLGAYDLAIIADFPNTSAAMKASIALTKLTGIGFTTSAAITVEEFDRMLG